MNVYADRDQMMTTERFKKNLSEQIVSLGFKIGWYESLLEESRESMKELLDLKEQIG